VTTQKTSNTAKTYLLPIISVLLQHVINSNQQPTLMDYIFPAKLFTLVNVLITSTCLLSVNISIYGSKAIILANKVSIWILWFLFRNKHSFVFRWQSTQDYRLDDVDQFIMCLSNTNFLAFENSIRNTL
jgi:hypothetical protein